MVSPLSRSVSVINCPRVELSSLFNHMVSLLLASSNSPILVNSEGFYPIIFLYGFILCFTMTVSVFIWSLSSTPSVLVFLRGSSLADHCFDFFFPTLLWVSRSNFGGYFHLLLFLPFFLVSPQF